MLVIDTDVLSIHHIFTGDKRYKKNKEFLSMVKTKESYTTIFNLLELCGILATVGDKKQVEELYRMYFASEEIKLLLPSTIDKVSNISWSEISEEMLEIIKRGTRFGDASILWICEEHDVKYFITWNIRHYEGKTSIQCFTPEQFLNNTKGLKR
ncbi:hypothetical protein AUJ66_01530 [Candidatus Desantisbacteria bacterium CG1_02_38_46]|uniref:PIN domain-containing protein n=3 Tax=unclassified Candidatus Desantisiibacteriota TaxID=3106372 RepID=A0A2H9P9C6_9BACT|nr:MAG: hypothetical protein AUJ66_01530 [Candidatus Desantisbacteria bacterium CG1_02_38_46]PIU51161.1 MAG: hypothetical protein COS91_05885 [Candidatus Desantisbacteria bacterium CG07_land_8_20_14_0_80_39_15]PIZ14758.1 MAG: hypothetical protein COY51_07365 [Candidatus Desantisbacteria bacterium CG_4_10_14_0_8_um_filter_39_17]